MQRENTMMQMPNFLIIGAAKAGTSALYQYLKQHPQIYMSSVKEPAFFAVEDENLNVCDRRVKNFSLNLIAIKTCFKELQTKKQLAKPLRCIYIAQKLPNA